MLSSRLRAGAGGGPSVLVALLLLALPAFLRAADEAIDPLLWSVTASHQAGNAIRACDRDATSRWDTGTMQKPGMWFRLDLGEVRPVSRLEFDSTGSGNDAPRRYALATSLDGTRWEPAGEGEGKPVTAITLPSPRRCRYVRMELPPSLPADVGNFWSIHEINLYGPPPGAGGLPRPPIRWRVVKPLFPLREPVIAGYDIRDFGIDPAKGADATTAIRLATRLLARAGGGTLWLPAGHYRLSEPLELGDNVAIRGDWKEPEPGKPIQGTILDMTAGRGDPDGTPGISLLGGAVVNGVAFWYPEQKGPDIVPYPAAVHQIGGKGMALENITFVNAYRGFSCARRGCALYFLRNVHGTVLETGIEIDGTADIGRLERIRLAPTYWSGSGMPGSPPAGGFHAAWMAEHGTGIAMRRNDWSYAYDVRIDGYRTGYYALPTLGQEPDEKDKHYPNGNHAKFRISNCRTGVRWEGCSDVGMLFHDLVVTGAEDALLAEATCDAPLQIQGAQLTGTHSAVSMLGDGQFLLSGCTITGAIINPKGLVSCVGCSGPAVVATAGQGPAVGELRVDATPVALPADPYQTPGERIAPPTDKLAVVTDAAFGAKGDAQNDDTPAVRKALASLGAGGGTVFFPGGEYRITAELEIPTGVELRGVSEGPHHGQTRGSIIDVLPGRGKEDGTPFITLKARAGLRGLTFHHPEQDATAVVAYPWLIRGAGEGVWIINATCTHAYRFIDLATNRCDRHFVDYAQGHAAREAFRIGGGSTGGRLLNCQLNPNNYAFTTNYANSPNKYGKEGRRYMDGCFAYGMANADAFVIGDCAAQILFQNFVFGAKRGLVLTGTASGPAGWCLGHGSDQCRWSVWAERMSAAGMPLINTQLVTVDKFAGEHGYIALAPAFTGTLSCIGVDAWGGPGEAIRADGGSLSLISAVISRSGQATISQRNQGRVALTNAVVRKPEALIQRDKASPPVQLGALLLTGRTPASIARLADVSEDFIVTRIPGNAIGLPFDPRTALPTAGWAAHASIRDNEAKRAIDGDPATRWDTGRGMRRGDEFTLDMQSPRPVGRVRMQTITSANDFPRRMKLYLSLDGAQWGEPVIAGIGESDLRLSFPARPARYLRIVCLGDEGAFWSINELQVAGQ